MGVGARGFGGGGARGDHVSKGLMVYGVFPCRSAFFQRATSFVSSYLLT